MDRKSDQPSGDELKFRCMRSSPPIKQPGAAGTRLASQTRDVKMGGSGSKVCLSHAQ